MRRAAISVGSNVAEGCGRRGDKALVAFVHIAIGSINELDFQIEVAIDLAFVSEADARDASDLLGSLQRMLIKFASRLDESANTE